MPNAAEGGAPGMFTFSRTGPTIGALRVNFTIGGTATPGSDYQTVSTLVNIPIGASNMTVQITPIDDAIVEGNETVVFMLRTSTNYIIGSPASATVTIADNDSQPTVKLFSTGAQMTVSWNSVAGKVYQVCYKNALSDPTWTPLGSPITATDTTSSYTDMPPTDSTVRFYNVLMQ
jgi:hypothetical protein